VSFRGKRERIGSDESGYEFLKRLDFNFEWKILGVTDRAARG